MVKKSPSLVNVVKECPLKPMTFFGRTPQFVYTSFESAASTQYTSHIGLNSFKNDFILMYIAYCLDI